MRNPGHLSQDEHERLTALHALGLLDTPREAIYDRIVRLVARHFAVPFAALALVDKDRVWLKAAHGAAVGEYARAGSLCSLALQQDAPLELKGAAAAQGSEVDMLHDYNRQAARGYELSYRSTIAEFRVGHHASLEQLLAAAEDAMHQLKHSRTG